MTGSTLPEKLTGKQNEIAAAHPERDPRAAEVSQRCRADYLTLSRSSGTLSGGESQRIRLASQIGSGLTGVLYVLDEPSIGLHQRDNDRLLETLKHLRDLGNTVIVVEHDEDAIRTADHVVDMGPGRGRPWRRGGGPGTPGGDGQSRAPDRPVPVGQWRSRCPSAPARQKKAKPRDPSKARAATT
jgi:excinuclease ABC subunit A